MSKRKYMQLQEFIRKHSSILFRILLIIFFFTAPFSYFIPLSGVPIPDLRLQASPPGYPVNGRYWTFILWGTPSKGGVEYEKVQNSKIIINTASGNNFIIYTNTNGDAEFTYTDDMGTVIIEASSDKFGYTSWVPQIKFISNEIARPYLAIYGIGVPTVIWQVFDENKKIKNDKISKMINSILQIFSITGFILCFIWFRKWKFGSEWGFGNRILQLFIPINFDPHLFHMTNIVFLLTFILMIKINIWKTISTAFSRHSEDKF